MIVVSDTTPLISLMKIGRLNLIEQLFGETIILSDSCRADLLLMDEMEDCSPVIIWWKRNYIMHISLSGAFFLNGINALIFCRYCPFLAFGAWRIYNVKAGEGHAC